jgi:hypothetical protein
MNLKKVGLTYLFARGFRTGNALKEGRSVARGGGRWHSRSGVTFTVGCVGRLLIDWQLLGSHLPIEQVCYVTQWCGAAWLDECRRVQAGVGALCGNQGVKFSCFRCQTECKLAAMPATNASLFQTVQLG